jgi:hypothetical protein
MGFCARPRFAQLAPFIASLRRTRFAGDVCLIVEDADADIIAQLRAHGIMVERAAPSVLSRMTAMAGRNFAYLDFLTSHAGDYAKVMLTDPANSVFQSDPFAASLPAEIVYTAERRRIGEVQPLHDAVVQAYGEGVARNIRDCAAANADITIGTLPGVLRYLAAMTRELGGRTTPITGIVDQAVHNYIVHMRPLRDACLDLDGAFCASLRTVRDDAVTCTDDDTVLIGGNAAPVLSHWSENAAVLRHADTAPRFRLDASMRGSEAAPLVAEATDAVVACYERERDAKWLPLFLGSLRCVNPRVAIHCIGDFDQPELATLSRHGCTAHPAPAANPDIAENIAHFFLSQVLNQLAPQPQQVLVLDCMCAIFPRDPFLTKTVGLSVFREGPTPIGNSDYNRDRLAFFTPLDEDRLRQPIVSSSVLRGTLPVVGEFHRRLFAELVGRADLLTIRKVVQGAVNKLIYDGGFGFPVTAHPNAAEVYFDYWASGLALDDRHGVRIGGAVPGVAIGGDMETPLMRKLRIDLGLTIGAA